MNVLGIDPGLKGSFVLTDGDRYIRIFDMPVDADFDRKKVSFIGVCAILNEVEKLSSRKPRVFLERAKPMAMGSGYAFNYGRDFQSLVIALIGWHVQLVEPSTWAKSMHEGIAKDLKPKAKSAIAVRDIFPHLISALPVRPKAKDFHDGPVDALLIAGYGLRRLSLENDEIDDFY